MSKNKAPQVAINLNEEDLIGGEEVKAERAPRLGEIVFYHANNQQEDGFISYPAIVTKVNLNNSVSITAFADTHSPLFTKVPLAKEAAAGYYTFSL